MLSDRDCELLTAYVDGELPSGERQSVERLLEQSSEARAFLEKLEGDSAELRRMPVRKAPDTLAEVVMDTVSDAPQVPNQPVLPAAADMPAGIPMWLGFAAAACVLLVVALATYLFFSFVVRDKPRERQEKQKANHVKREIQPIREFDPLLNQPA
jgi:anti-sigma factor RsiW